MQCPPDLWGEKNSTWKGDLAGYEALHKRVRRRRGAPARCSRCGTVDPSKRYEWANLTGKYEDPNDYERMCKMCHQRYDCARRGRVPIVHGTAAGWQGHQKRGEHPCEPCRLARNEYTREAYRRRRVKVRTDTAHCEREFDVV